MAAITIRYSDAPGETRIKLVLEHDGSRGLVSQSMLVEEIEAYRV